MKPKSQNKAVLEINVRFQFRQKVYPLNCRQIAKWVGVLLAIALHLLKGGGS